jgi:hypothetical protein
MGRQNNGLTVQRDLLKIKLDEGSKLLADLEESLEKTSE